MILFINACVREDSRTKRLAEYLIARLDGKVTEVRLSEISFPSVDEAFITRRDELAREGRFDDPIFTFARTFAEADCIVIAAPFWDLSFPAILKQYFELVNAVGVTFVYSPEGIPEGLCRARTLYYVTTAGGPIFCEEYGFGYIRALAAGFYQIPRVELIKAENLDIQGTDVEGILQEAEKQIQTIS